MAAQQSRPELRIVNVAPLDSTERWGEHDEIFRLEASADLFGSEAVRYLAPLVTLERVFAENGLRIIAEKNRRPTDGPNNAYIIADGSYSNPVPVPVTADNLNAFLAADVAPDVRVARSTTGEHPGLITAHRNVAIGECALRYINDLDTIENAGLVNTSGAEFPYYLYGDGCLLVAVAAPGADLIGATLEIHSALTL